MTGSHGKMPPARILSAGWRGFKTIVQREKFDTTNILGDEKWDRD